MSGTKGSTIGFLCCGALLAALTGCSSHADGRHHARGDAPPPPEYVASGVVVVQDDYVYYPTYQVYYSSNRRQYIYQDGRSWVTRPVPARVSVDVLFASPSVRLDFHDSPAVHHAAVVRQYPKHWTPPGSSSDHGQGNRDDGQGNGQGGRK